MDCEIHEFTVEKMQEHLQMIEETENRMRGQDASVSDQVHVPAGKRNIDGHEPG